MLPMLPTGYVIFVGMLYICLHKNRYKATPRF